MIFRLQSYLQFLWHSKNEHGVHSPFVFLLLTQCFYNKKIKLPTTNLSQFEVENTKKNRLLYKILQYFKPKSVLIVGPTTFTKEVLALGSPKATIDIDINIAKYDCIYFSSENNFKLTNEIIEKFLITIENDSFWILEHMHANAESEMIWKTLQSHPKVTVTVDTYKLGLVFFRKEQVKEHFIIRA
jgi:hypothetical protein